MTIICDKCESEIKGDNFRLGKYDICAVCFSKVEEQVDSWIQGKAKVRVTRKSKETEDAIEPATFASDTKQRGGSHLG